MRLTFMSVLLAAMVAGSAQAESPKLPSTATQLSGEELSGWMDGKKFNVVIYDAEVPLTAKINWDLAGKRVYGTYVAGDAKGKFDNPWVIKGDTSCAEKASDGKWICQRIFVDGEVMYEVNSNGKIHAVSKPR